MRLSQFWLTTQKETPADAEVISHQLMLRAGMIRQAALGIYSWLPLGLRVLRKVEQIIREEMNRAGSLEILMPSAQPAELWQESGRWQAYGPELQRFIDRHEREYCLGPTHEEVVTDLMRRDLASYKQLPLNVYQIQTKFRDEIRPRFGVMRGREFLMKDAYSFHLDEASLQDTYQTMFDAYCRIFERLGLDYRPVLADNGSIGGTGSHEFHVLAATGEDAIVFSTNGNYAANIEKAEAQRPAQTRPAPSAAMEKRETPHCKTIAALVENYGVPIERTIKTLMVAGAEGGVVALIIRGDHELNAIKAEHLPEVAAPLRMAEEAEIRAALGAGAGSLGPVGANVPMIVDYDAAVIADFAAGANEDGYHYFNINWERDVPLPKVADLRNVVEGDESPDGQGRLKLARGIEVGHVFQLRDKYTQAMNVSFLDNNGKSQIMEMGCYGIGITRVVAAAIEQNNDEKGIIWTKAMAPFEVVIVPMNYKKSDAVREAADKIYAELLAAGADVLLDDRDERAGVLLNDSELLGIPHRIVIGDRALKEGNVEYAERRDNQAQAVAVSEVVAKVLAALNA